MTPTGNQPLTFAQFCLATGWTVNRAREFMAKPAPLTATILYAVKPGQHWVKQYAFHAVCKRLAERGLTATITRLCDYQGLRA